MKIVETKELNVLNIVETKELNVLNKFIMILIQKKMNLKGKWIDF